MTVSVPAADHPRSPQIIVTTRDEEKGCHRWLPQAFAFPADCPQVGFVEVKSLFTFYPRAPISCAKLRLMIGAAVKRTMVLAFLEKWLHLCSRSRVAEHRTFCIMLRNGIAQFVGSWVSESGYHLRIKKARKGRVSVDFLDPRGAPVQRPYMGGAPSLKMVAHYDDCNGMFEVELWEEGGGRHGVRFAFDSRVQLRAGSGATRSARASPQPK